MTRTFSACAVDWEKKVKKIRFLAYSAKEFRFYHHTDKEPGKGFSII